MAEYRTVRMAFWQDPFIEELDAKGKLIYLYLFTCPYTNNLGVVEATRKRIAYETATSQAEIDKYLSEYERCGKVITDENFPNLIFLTNFIKHQTSTSPLIMKGLRALAPSIPSPVIARALCIRYPNVYDVNKEESDTVSIPYANGMHTLCISSGEVGIWKLEVGRGKGEDAGPKPPDCPHAKIREMYHETLPELPRAVTWAENRQELLKTRWRETWERLRQADHPHDEEALLAWWKAFFARVRASPFLMGKVVDRGGKPFFADLEWLVRPTNYAKVLDGKYLDRKPTP